MKRFKKYYFSYLPACISLVKSKIFIYLLLLNLISNCSYSYTDKTFIPIGIMVCLSFSLAYIEMFLYRLFSKIRFLGKIYFICVSILYILLIIIDYFCLFKFQTTINQDKIDIIRETTTKETAEFLHTYLSAGLVIGILLACLLFNVLLFILSNVIAKCRKLNIIYFLLSLVGFCIWVFMVFSFIKYRNGFVIPQYTSITRVAYSCYISKQRQDRIKHLYIVCRNVKASAGFADKPNVVVLIGESASIYHSGLFGYKYNTTPNQKRLAYKDDLIAFSNAVSVDDHTHGVMESVFSLDSLGTNFDKIPLFPIIFRKAGYKTFCYDNQYFIGGINFLSNAILSNIMFTYRNSKGFVYDEDLVNSIHLSKQSSLYIIHLFGQHYTYNIRYPKRWNKFKADIYDKSRWNEEQRTKIAEYDNATLYNDFVINKVIEKFKNTNTILVYFSDHGEEVFETRDYNGHGNAAFSPNIKYQIRVPLFVWVSDKYKKHHPKIYSKLKEVKKIPIITDDISHTLLSLAGLKTRWYNPHRDIISNTYNKKKPRIVLNSINFDTYKPQSVN